MKLVLFALACFFSIGHGFSQRLDVVTFPGSEKSAYATSYILTSGRESILLNPPRSATECHRLADTITKLNRHIAAVLISQARPDYYLGVSEIRKAFPSVRVIASHEVAIEIARSGPAEYDSLKLLMDQDMPAPLVLPDSTLGDEIVLGNLNIQVKSFTNGDAETTSVLYEPKQRFLFTGDIVNNKVHFNLNEQMMPGWLQELQDLKKFDVYKIFPGHGLPGNASLIEECFDYIQTFQKALTTGYPVAIVDIMNYYLPGYMMPANLKASILQYVKRGN